MMRYSERESLSITKPAPPPVDLDFGSLNVLRVSQSAGFALASVFVAMFGVWVASWSRDNSIFPVAGFCIVLLALAFGLSVSYVSITQFIDHRERVKRWDRLTFRTYAEAGLEKTEVIREHDLVASNDAHVVLMALVMMWRVTEGEELPFSARRMMGPVFYGSRQVGHVSKTQALELSRRFAELGLIEGRSDGHPGRWVVDDFNELCSILWQAM